VPAESDPVPKLSVSYDHDLFPATAAAPQPKGDTDPAYRPHSKQPAGDSGSFARSQPQRQGKRGCSEKDSGADVTPVVRCTDLGMLA
jgi:hypothetical protein